MAQILKQVFIFFLFAIAVKGQTTLPEQDCIHAIPLCQNIYSNTTAYSGTGTIPNEINPLYSCLSTGEKNDVWYVFTVQSAGEINFTITPFSGTDDYDWAVFNLTNSLCSNIFSDSSLQVSCNYDANTGCGGATGPNGLMSACGQSEPTISVLAGETYVVNVSNYSSSQSGYTINFSASTAMIYDGAPPSRTSVTVDCNQTNFSISFNEAISCNTISAAGNDFMIVDSLGYATPIQNVIGKGCNSSNPYIDSLEISLSQPLVDYATYYLIAQNGGDGNTISDKCGNFILVDDTVAIIYIHNNLNVTLGNDLQICPNDAAPVLQSNILNASLYQWSFNSQLVNDSTSSFSANDTGVYALYVSLGEMCFAFDTISVSNKPALNFNLGNDTTICTGQTLPVLNCGIANAQQYHWYLNGTAVGNNLQSYQPTNAGIITVEVEKINFCVGSDTIILSSVAPPQISLGSDVGICSGDTVSLSSPTTFSFYEWRLGSLVIAFDSSIAIATTGNYILKAGINSGCFDADTISVFSKQITHVSLGKDLNACVYDALPQVTATSAASSFQWYFNDTLLATSTNTLQSIGTGNYVVTAQQNNYCIGSDTLQLTVAEVLPVEFGNDTSVCIQNNFSLDATVLSNGIYHWFVDGIESENHSSVFEMEEEGFYKMVFSGSTGCTASDSIYLNERFVPTKPEVNCPQQNGNEKIFTWTAVNGATNYEVSTDNGITWTQTNSTTDLKFSATSTIRKILVRAVGDALCYAGESGESKFCEVNVNTLLTPDGDGVNDFFEIEGAENPIQLSLYDVAGKEVFRDYNYRNNFDGNKLSRGIYMYRIKPAKAEYVTGKLLLMK